MSLTSRALANLRNDHRQADVSRYVAEQIVLRNRQENLGDFDWHKANLDLLRDELQICETITDNTLKQPDRKPRHVSRSSSSTHKLCPSSHEVMTCTTHNTSKVAELSYQKQARQKMREDPVHISMASSRTSRGTGKRTSRTISGSKAKKAKRVKRLVESSTVEDITGNRTRLTLKPHHSLGLFKNGRASAQVNKRGLPDLTFCEMAFLQGGDKHKSSSGEQSESSNTPEPSKTPSYFSSITNTVATDIDGYQRMFRLFDPHSVDQLSASVVPSVTNLVVHTTDEIPIQQTAQESYPCNSPPHVPPEAPSLTERNNITNVEWSRECQLAVNSEESYEEGPAKEEKKPLSIPQQAQLGMSLKLHCGEVSRPLEIPGGMAACQVEGVPHDHISSEDLTCQRIKVPNASIKRDIRSPSPLSSLLHACDDLLSHQMPLSTKFLRASSPIRDRRTELWSSPLPLALRPVPCQSAEIHQEDTSILMEYSTTDGVQNQPQPTLQWHMRKPSENSTELYSFAGIHNQHGPGFPDYAESRMEVAYPPYTVEFSPFIDDEIYACNSDYGGDNSDWNTVLENDSTQRAECSRAILGAGVDRDDAPDTEGCHGQLVDIRSSYRSLSPIELEEGLGDSMEDNAHISTFCWRPYWRT